MRRRVGGSVGAPGAQDKHQWPRHGGPGLGGEWFWPRGLGLTPWNERCLSLGE